MKSLFLKIQLIILAFLLTSCGAFRTAAFDQHSYQKTTEIKVEALNLMDKAQEQYIMHEANVDGLLLDMQKILEYEKNKPNNEITYGMWKLIANPDKNLLAGFFKRWKDKGKLNEIFIGEFKKEITEAMDLLLKFEGKKDPEAEKGLLGLLSLN